MLCLLPLIRVRARDRVQEKRKFIHIQLAIVIPVRPSELYFQESKHLILQDWAVAAARIYDRVRPPTPLRRSGPTGFGSQLR